MTRDDLVGQTWAYSLKKLSLLAFVDILGIDAVPITQDQLEAQWEVEVDNTGLDSVEKLA